MVKNNSNLQYEFVHFLKYLCFSNFFFVRIDVVIRVWFQTWLQVPYIVIITDVVWPTDSSEKSKCAEASIFSVGTDQV